MAHPFGPSRNTSKIEFNGYFFFNYFFFFINGYFFNMFTKNRRLLIWEIDMVPFHFIRTPVLISPPTFSPKLVFSFHGT